MANEKWEQVKEVFDAALRHKPEDRPQFLDEVCANNETVRHEVESLLSSFDHADNFMDKPLVGEMVEATTIKRNVLAKGHHLGRYEILKPIGAGGMGEVYLAHDTQLKRKVAVKLLSSDFTDNQERLRRFKQEARAASALNHPNILTIHEIGIENDTHFIATEFIEGITLRQQMQNGQIELEEILNIATQTAAALSAAHAAGIVHRDIKPENIMLRSDGIVKVLDFGLAKTVATHEGQSVVTGEETTMLKAITNPRVVMGTVAYMSPEQARGKAIDARTDVFSFGVMLYEMVSGRLPFMGETTADVLGALLNKEPVPLNRLAPDAPTELQHIINKALRKDRDERYQTMKSTLADLKTLKQELEFAAKLERSTAPDKFVVPSGGNLGNETMPPEGTTNLIHTTSSAEYLVTEIKRHKAVALVALAVLLLASVGFGIWYFKHRSAPAAQIESIAVMPFVNESGNADVEYLSDGMTESLINRLSQIPNLSVKARNTVFRYKGKDANTAAKELNVQAVLTGRVVQRGDELTLFLELIDAATENQIWGKQYNRKMTNIVTLQNEIARDVSDNLQTKLSGADEQKLAKRYTENSEAYQLYLRGRFHWNKRLPNEHRKAIEYFGQAVAVDPNYALGYAGIADAYTILWNQGGGSREMMPKAKEAALKAISLDDGLAEGHSALGYILTTYDLDFAAAEREFKRAIELNPNYAPAHQQYGRLLSDQTRHEEALTEMRRALEIDPLSLPINWSYGIDLFYARKYDEAIAQLKKTQELHPDFPRTHSWLARIYHLQGRYAECVEAWAKNHELEGKPEIAAFLRESFARDGWEGFMQATINRQMFEYILLANFYAALGEKDKSFAELNKAYENRSNQLHLLKVDPRLDPLRDDPRFQELLRRVGLSP